MHKGVHTLVGLLDASRLVCCGRFPSQVVVAVVDPPGRSLAGLLWTEVSHSVRLGCARRICEVEAFFQGAEH